MKLLLSIAVVFLAVYSAHSQVTPTDTITNTAERMQSSAGVQLQPTVPVQPGSSHTDINKSVNRMPMKPPTQPPNTNGIPPSPGTPAAGPVNAPISQPTQPAVDPRLLPKP